jgi:hypothetical protein
MVSTLILTHCFVVAQMSEMSEMGGMSDMSEMSEMSWTMGWVGCTRLHLPTPAGRALHAAALAQWSCTLLLCTVPMNR